MATGGRTALPMQVTRKAGGERMCHYKVIRTVGTRTFHCECGAALRQIDHGSCARISPSPTLRSTRSRPRGAATCTHSLSSGLSPWVRLVLLHLPSGIGSHGAAKRAASHTRVAESNACYGCRLPRRLCVNLARGEQG